MTNLRKKAAILASIYIVFLVLGLWFNGQQGIRHGDGFWKQQDAGWYRASGGNRVRFDPDAPGSGNGVFQLELDGTALSAVRTQREDGHVQVAFSDGWTVDADEAQGFASFIIVTSSGGDIVFHDGMYTLTDMDAGTYRFASAEEEIRTPFYGEDGSAIGESVMLLSADGVVLDQRDVWYDRPELNAPEKETIVLKTGVTLSGSMLNQGQYLFVNEAGEYLTHPVDPTQIVTKTDTHSRVSLLRLMEAVAAGEAESMGHSGQALLYTLLYALGAASLLWPNQMAFFGSRWRYKNNPELSEDGLQAAYIGGFLVLAVSLVMLFLPLF